MHRSGLAGAVDFGKQAPGQLQVPAELLADRAHRLIEAGDLGKVRGNVGQQRGIEFGALALGDVDHHRGEPRRAGFRVALGLAALLQPSHLTVPRPDDSELAVEAFAPLGRAQYGLAMALDVFGVHQRRALGAVLKAVPGQEPVNVGGGLRGCYPVRLRLPFPGGHAGRLQGLLKAHLARRQGPLQPAPLHRRARARFPGGGAGACSGFRRDRVGRRLRRHQ
jgi:hypothetical protein